MSSLSVSSSFEQLLTEGKSDSQGADATCICSKYGKNKLVPKNMSRSMAKNRTAEQSPYRLSLNHDVEKSRR